MTETIEPRDLAALEKAVNDAAGRAGSVWLSFITLGTYLLITTGSVTHKHLFLEKELRLPVFAVDLPLVGFFVAGPLLFVIFHFYTLLQLHGLASKIAQYEVVLREAVPHRSDRELVRERLDTFVFVQMLAGTPERREGVIGFLNRLMVWITMIVLPLAVLLLVQIIFLPYQRELVTWLHRFIVLVDLALIWWFWRPTTLGASRSTIVHLWPIASPKLPERLRRVRDWLKSNVLWLLPKPPLTASITVGAFSLLIAASPSETIYLWPWRHFTALIFEGGRGPVTVSSGLLGLSNHLILPDEHFITDERLKKDEATMSMRGRNLHSAMLDRSDLTQADFTGADLRRASLRGARLQRARFLCIGDTVGEARRASQTDERRLGQCALLQGASLRYAQLQGAYLNRAHLQSADLFGADLRDASLDHARLQGATFWGAELTGASLRYAQLQGAGLSFSDLRGASLDNAYLQGAGLWVTDLRGASLDHARLQGAEFPFAKLEGATLWNAQLQGAWLGSQLYRTSLNGTYVYRAATSMSPPQESLLEVRTSSVLDERRPDGSILGGDAAAYEKFVNAIVDSVPSETQDLVRNRLRRLAPSYQSTKEDLADVEFWNKAKSLSIEEYQQRLTETLIKLSCDAAGAPHIARALIRHGRVKDTGDHFQAIAEKLKHPVQCPGANGLTAEDLRALDR
jgi:uncharacterized protein YjbI with pentapeptide repeats